MMSAVARHSSATCSSEVPAEMIATVPAQGSRLILGAKDISAYAAQRPTLVLSHANIGQPEHIRGHELRCAAVAVQHVQPKASGAQGAPGKRGCFLLPEALSVRMRAGALYCTSGSSGSTSEYTCTCQRAATSGDTSSGNMLQTQHSPCWCGVSSHV